MCTQDTSRQRLAMGEPANENMAGNELQETKGQSEPVTFQEIPQAFPQRGPHLPKVLNGTCRTNPTTLS